MVRRLGASFPVLHQALTNENCPYDQWHMSSTHHMHDPTTAEDATRGGVGWSHMKSTLGFRADEPFKVVDASDEWLKVACEL